MKENTGKMKRFLVLILYILLSVIFTFGQTNKDYDKPVKIISKPRASYPKPEKETLCAQGTVTLRVLFLKTGEIGKIAVVNGLLKGFEEKAVEAAKKIKFKPAMKDGKPVTVTRQVQYSFSLY